MLLKKLLLMASTLAIVVVLFIAYHLGTGGQGQLADDLAGAPKPEDFRAVDETSRKKPSESAPKIEDVELSQGRKGLITWFDPKTQQKRLQFRADRWNALSDNEVHMVGPEFRLLMPGGQIANVRADECQIEVLKIGDNYEPRRGWLRGHVQILIDRTRPQWRQENPDRAEMEQHPEYVVRMWMEEVRFDLDLARLETASPFRVQSVEADIEGEGLLLRWNERDDRIEQLSIARGKRMELRGRRLVTFALPGSGETADSRPPGDRGASLAMAPVRLVEQPTEAPDRPRPPVPSAANLGMSLSGPVPAGAGDLPATAVSGSAEADSPTVIDGEEVLVIGRQDRRRLIEPKPTVYEASFAGGVEVRQKDGQAVAGRLLAETLELLFDFGQRQRDLVAEEPGEDPSLPRGGSSIELVWSGAMTMKPRPTDPAEAMGNRLHVMATGSPVRLEAGQGHASSDEFTYENETGRARLVGGEGRPVVVQSVQGDRLTGPVVFLDRHRGLARVEGGGRMIRERRAGGEADRRAPGDPGRQVTIDWQRGVELVFGVTERGREFLQRATFEGQVAVLEGADTAIKADFVEAIFTAPSDQKTTVRTEGERLEVRGEIERLDCRGNVHLYRPEEEIRCGQLLVEMDRDARGEPYPRVADAWGQVVVRQGRARIEASRHVLAKMRAAEVTTAGRRSAAVRTEPQIVDLLAVGDVRAVDPRERLDLSCEELTAHFGPNRSIETATVEGGDGRMASVRKDDYKVRGMRVEIDARAPSLTVPGEGSLEFKADRRLLESGRGIADEPDGRSSPTLPMVVSFQERMRLLGDRDVILVDGRVEVVGREAGELHPLTRKAQSPDQSYSLACQNLRIDLADDATPDAPSPEPQNKPVGDWLRNLWAGEPQHRSASRFSVSKKAVFLLADGQAVAGWSTWHPRDRALQTRMQVSGPRIATDLQRRRLNVEGEGALLIEDYRLPGRRTRAAPASGGEPLLGNLGAEGPSQSLFTWRNSLTYLQDPRVAILDRGVEVIHRSGGQVAYAEQLARAGNLSPESLRTMGGRRVTLSCENLLVEFLNDIIGAQPAPDGASALKRFQASGNVHLQEGTKSIHGQRVNYWQETETVQVEGGAGEPARFFDADPKSSHLRQQLRGESLRWDRRTGRIEAIRPALLATRP